MTAVQRVQSALKRLAESDRPEAWITLRPAEDLLAEAAAVDARAAGPLAGRLIAVKDNIDVAGLPTTAACPAYAYMPTADAAAVACLRAAGAIVVGKTNLDQFATGLVGTRSPHGAVRDVARAEYVSGGSSSGSAVVVALGIVDAALGTDTAGSGRIPAAFQGLIGLKPTRGVVSNQGVVPACRSLDCVSVLTADLAIGQDVMWTMAGAGAPSRSWPGSAPLGAPPTPVLAVPAADQLADLSSGTQEAFGRALERMIALGASVKEIDLAPFLAAGQLLYGGAFVAERYAAVGEFVDTHPEEVDPIVGSIIGAGGAISAARMVDDIEALGLLAAEASAQLAGADALMVPTAPRQPTIAEVAADPIAVNAELGRFTTFANLLDMAVVALPAGRADGGNFGISLVAPAFSDLLLADLAGRFLADRSAGAALPAGAPRGIPLLVVGAHRRGQPLNYQLTERGARFDSVRMTAPEYRLHALDTQPPKPGLVRVAAGGTAIEGELWELPSAELGPFLAALPPPMALTSVTLADGRGVVGFSCEPAALEGAPDISAFGSWLRYLESRA